VLELVEEGDCCLRRRLARQKLHQFFVRAVGLAGFETRIAFRRLMMGDLPKGFMNRDAHEKPEQVVLGRDLESIVLEACEKGAKNGLNDVLRVDAAGQALTDPAPRQRQQPLDIRIE